jgi:hypothetical protein
MGDSEGRGGCENVKTGARCEMNKALLVLCALLGYWTLAAAANLTGQWSLDLMPDFGGNNDNVGCSFRQDGEKLTLNCGAGPNIIGEVQGRKVTLRVPTGDKNELVGILVGELDEREATISGTWKLANDRGPTEGKFLFKKLSDK